MRKMCIFQYKRRASFGIKDVHLFLNEFLEGFLFKNLEN